MEIVLYFMFWIKIDQVLRWTKRETRPVNTRKPTIYLCSATSLRVIFFLIGVIACCISVCGCADRDASAGIVQRIDRLTEMLTQLENGIDFRLNVVAEYRTDAQKYLRWAWLKRIVNRDKLINEYNRFNLRAEGYERKYNSKGEDMLRIIEEFDRLIQEFDTLSRHSRISRRAKARIQQFNQDIEKASPRLLGKLAQLERSKSELASIMNETEYSVMENPPRLTRGEVAWSVPDVDVVLKAAQLGLSLGGKSKFCKGAAILLSIVEVLRAIEKE